MKILTIFLVIIIFFILYILLFIKKTDKYKDDYIYNYLDIKNKLKSGDIILFSCKNNKSFYNSIEYYLRTELIGSEYGHVGIIIRNKDKLFILECVSNNHCAKEYALYLNNLKKGGIRIVELETLLKEYLKENDAIFAIKFISNEIPNNIILKNIEKYIDKTFEDKYKLYIMGFMDVCISHNLSEKINIFCGNNNKSMCSEFVHNFLYECNVLKKYQSKLFWPHLITNDELFSFLEIIKYSKPFKFKFGNHNNNYN